VFSFSFSERGYLPFSNPPLPFSPFFPFLVFVVPFSFFQPAPAVTSQKVFVFFRPLSIVKRSNYPLPPRAPIPWDESPSFFRRRGWPFILSFFGLPPPPPGSGLARTLFSFVPESSLFRYKSVEGFSFSLPSFSKTSSPLLKCQRAVFFTWIFFFSPPHFGRGSAIIHSPASLNFLMFAHFSSSPFFFPQGQP